MILMSSIERIWCGTCRGFKRQALYTRREDPWFCVVNRTRTTSKTPMGFKYSSLMFNIMSLIVLIAVLVTLPFCLLKAPIREFGNRQRRRWKTKSLICVVYKPTHTLLVRPVLSDNSQRIHNKQPK